MTDNATGTAVTTTISPLSFADTVSRLTSLLDAKRMKIFSVIDQRAGTAWART
jgi:hypothetical protein